SPGRFLETLITYIILPITAVFTIILLIYIIANIRQDFWTDNLMEPLLISYSITVILVYLLASTLNNTMARLFRSIFPKVLVPIVLFQVVASLLKTREVGITYGRYYVILFGIFAVISGVIFCFKSVHKNGLIAPVLIVLSLISILPFINAFTLSREVQENRLQKVLEQNNMLVGQKVVPRPEISKNDKEIIISSIEYLEEVDAVEGYDYMMRTYVGKGDEQVLLEDYAIDGNIFSLYKEDNELILKDLTGEELHFSINRLYEKASTAEEYDTNLDTQELIFTEENATARLTVVAENITINLDNDNHDIQADIYVLIDFK
ncbi:MAG: putative rane protein, partial [Herbinix sp.]|nr:putative rane protein [Herbinix sp.]